VSKKLPRSKKAPVKKTPPRNAQAKRAAVRKPDTKQRPKRAVPSADDDQLKPPLKTAPKKSLVNRAAKRKVGRPSELSSRRSHEKEQAVVTKALTTLSNSELKVIAISPICCDLLHDTARTILGNRREQRTTTLPIVDAERAVKSPSVAVAAGRDGTQNDSSDSFALAQIPDGLLEVRHGRKYRQGSEWVLATKKNGVTIRKFAEEPALDQWWKDFKKSQHRKPLPLVIGRVETKQGKLGSRRKKAKKKRKVKRGGRVLPAQGQTRKVGSHRSIS